jgi:hypothetical protein
MVERWNGGTARGMGSGEGEPLAAATFALSILVSSDRRVPIEGRKDFEDLGMHANVFHGAAFLSLAHWEAFLAAVPAP